MKKQDALGKLMILQNTPEDDVNDVVNSLINVMQFV
jgi:hypothetical protein